MSSTVIPDRGRRLVSAVAALVLASGVAAGQAVAAPQSAARAQYGNAAPITKQPSSGGGSVAGTSAQQNPTVPAVRTSGLPFTGTSLVAPVVFALVLLVAGFALRRKFGRSSPQA